MAANGLQREPVMQRLLRDYASVAPALTDAAVPAAARQRAAAAFSAAGWPSGRDEHWRYAPLRAFEQSEFAPASGALADTPDLPPALAGFERLVLVDGRRAQVPGAAPLALVGGLEWPSEQRLGYLADMFATDTVRLHVAATQSLELLFVTSAHPAGAVYPRLEILLAPNASLTLIERHLGGGPAATLINAVARIELGRGAQLTHYRLQQCGAGANFADTLAVHVGEAAQYRARSLAVGAAHARSSVRVRLAGRDAGFSWQAVALGQGEQVQDATLRVEHAAAATRTEEQFRGIADGGARLAFAGHVQIQTGADGADVRQSLRGLIEGTRAEIDLRPRLEINTDDVKATHGATTGRLDEALMFYLRSRGLDPATARTLLKWAFLGDVLREFELPALRAEAERAAAGQLGDVLFAGVVR